MQTIYQIDKKDFGYSVAIDELYSLIGNPCFNSFNLASYPFISEGSVDIYKYDTVTVDGFVYDKTIKRTAYEQFILYTENNTFTSSLESPFSQSAGSHDLNTESNTSPSASADFLLADADNIRVFESDFGRSLDMWGNLAVIGSTKVVYSLLHIEDVIRTEEGVVEIHDVSQTDSLLYPIYPKYVHDVSSSFDTGSNSFGWSVSINENFVAVGSPYTNNAGDVNTTGSVFIFKTGSTGYTFHSRLTASNSDVKFYGSCLKLDKNFDKLVVGNSATQVTNSAVYLYEYITSSNSWSEIKSFSPDRVVENLNFIPVLQHDVNLTNGDGFGNSVTIYCSSSSEITVAIGSPYDRIYKEYTGSDCYRNGCVYVFDLIHCESNGFSSSYWKQTKLFGDGDAFKFNRFGHAVDIYDKNLIVSSPKYFSEFSSSYLQNTLFKSVDCDDISENDYLGMFYIYQQTDGDWNNVYSKYKPIKRYGYPYNFFAHDVGIFEENIVVGSPIPITSPNSASINILGSNAAPLQNINGDFGIYNLSDFEAHHHIGNVFYKTGKMVLSTNNSIFDEIFESDVNDEPVYDIYYNSKERLYEKEIICNINPGEFNYSTNPTSYYKPTFLLDINKNGQFDFEDCDKILRAIYKKIRTVESWWDLFSIENPISFTDKVESSLFYHYVSASFGDKSSVSLVNEKLTNEEYSYISDNLNYNLDINSDGITDDDDIRIIWAYFTNLLTSINYNDFITSKSVGVRSNFSQASDYLDEITGRRNVPTILNGFQTRWESESMNPTGSYMVPYITTIGLYNGLDLVGVAKLGTPIKNEGYFPLNFIIRFDI